MAVRRLHRRRCLSEVDHKLISVSPRLVRGKFATAQNRSTLIMHKPQLRAVNHELVEVKRALN